MTEYKVGDRVRVIAGPGSTDHPGENGVIVSVDPTVFPFKLRFDNGEYEDFDAEDLAPAPDVVSRPPHYRDGVPPGIEVIDIIRAHMRAGGTWETANALKYILRHTLKNNPTQDIHKAIQYLNMWVQQQETE